MHINLNTTIKVKLTELGKEIYYKEMQEVIDSLPALHLKQIPLEEDENGYCKFLLWKFMQTYGKHLGMCTPLVIDPIEIVIENDELRREINHAGH